MTKAVGQHADLFPLVREGAQNSRAIAYHRRNNPNDADNRSQKPCLPSQKKG